MKSMRDLDDVSSIDNGNNSLRHSTIFKNLLWDSRYKCMYHSQMLSMLIHNSFSSTVQEVYAEK